MALQERDRITLLRMIVEALRHKNERANVHGPPPELREQRALHAHMADVLRVLWRFDGGHYLGQLHRNHAVRPDPNVPGFAVEVSWREIPLLAFAVVHVQLQHVAVGAMERLINIENRLDRILARRKIGQGAQWGAGGAGLHADHLARLPAIDIAAEDLLRFDTVSHLKPRLAVRLFRDDDDQPAVRRRGPSRSGEFQFKGRGGRQADAQNDTKGDETHKQSFYSRFAAPARRA